MRTTTINNKTKHRQPSIQLLPQDLSDTQEYLTVNTDDLNLYFAGTLLYFEDSKRWEKVKDFYADGSVFIHSFWDTLASHRLKDRQIRFGFPPIGFYNFKKGVIDFRRKTHRQNKKGLCATSGEVDNVLSLYKQYTEIPFSFHLSQLWSWKPQTLTTVFEKSEYLDVEDAYSEVKQLKSFARAMSPSLFIGQGIGSSQPVLWFNHTLIGRFVSKKKLVVDNLMFLQEAVDFLLPQGIEVDGNSA